MKTEKKNPYNPTCIVSGAKHDLHMYAIRNDEGRMIGWIFLHETLDPKLLNHNFKYKWPSPKEF